MLSCSIEETEKRIQIGISIETETLCPLNSLFLISALNNNAFHAGDEVVSFWLLWSIIFE